MGLAADDPDRLAPPDAKKEDDAPLLPSGYQRVYEQPMDAESALADFVFSDPTAWRYGSVAGRSALEQFQASKYAPPHRSPLNIALVDARQFDDFVLDARLLQSSKEYGHRDMCLFFGFQDPAHFYYAHIATKTDDHAHNLFIVNDQPRAKISKRTTAGHDWGQQAWHHARLVRDSHSGKIELYVGDMKQPIMEAVDKTFGAGWVGFGTFDDTGFVDDVTIWAPHVTQKKVDFFPSASAESTNSR